MDLLENLVIPATTQHLALLKVILVLALLIFLPFFGMLLGGTGFSVIFNAYGRKIKNKLFKYLNNIKIRTKFIIFFSIVMISIIVTIIFLLLRIEVF